MEEPKNVKTVTVRELRSNFKSIADNINDYDTTVIVARPKNKNVVIISQKEYDSWQETAYLLGTEANRTALMEAKRSFEKNDPNNKLLTPEDIEKLSRNN
ncbi:MULTISPECIES: type II toxin-antitoxin system Phd/YefM family antitoxin [Bacilli]|nr:MULTISPECIES: type II toxin-antitoxin system Phd/YefM family antitoxin [Bacilli]